MRIASVGQSPDLDCLMLLLRFLGIAGAAVFVTLWLLPAASAVAGECANVTLPPEKLRLDPFYKKYCSADGIPIVTSEHVPDAALRAAAEIVTEMLKPMPAVRERLQSVGLRIAIIGAQEKTSDIPEYKPVVQRYPERDWDARTRGIASPSPALPVTSGAEENILCYANDRYRGENILVHEFSHSIKILGLQAINPGFKLKVEDAYRNAQSNGLWARTYAIENPEEYWAEGVQSYFDTNLFSDPPNGIHNAINTRAKLRGYDPQLFALIDDAFKSSNWRPRCP